MVEPFARDLLIMNPPFSDQMNHIRHAYNFLAEGGQLITVASSMILSGRTKKDKEFIEWFSSVDGSQCMLNPGSFKETGTGVNTGLLVFYRD